MKNIHKIKKSLRNLDCNIQKILNSQDFKKIILFSLISFVMLVNLHAINFQNKTSQIKEPARKIQEPNPWEKNIRQMTKGFPIEAMTPYISKRDKMTAAFLVGIAKKESNWGKYSPKLNGQDCFNYWGYRGRSESMTNSGYTCFESPRHAINVVSKRIDDLTKNSKLTTPKKMAVWKCGWDCSWDNPAAVDKWVKDVDYYFQKFYQ